MDSNLLLCGMILLFSECNTEKHKIRLNFIVALTENTPSFLQANSFTCNKTRHVAYCMNVWTREMLPEHLFRQNWINDLLTKTREKLNPSWLKAAASGNKITILTDSEHTNVSSAGIHELRSTNKALCFNNFMIHLTPLWRSTLKITTRTMTSQYWQVAFLTKTVLTTNHRQKLHS